MKTEDKATKANEIIAIIMNEIIQASANSLITNCKIFFAILTV